MNKEQLIKKYLHVKSMANGYLNMQNPNFNNDYYNNLVSEVEQLEVTLKNANITETEITDVQKQMEQTGEYLER